MKISTALRDVKLQNPLEIFMRLLEKKKQKTSKQEVKSSQPEFRLLRLQAKDLILKIGCLSGSFTFTYLDLRNVSRKKPF